MLLKKVKTTNPKKIQNCKNQNIRRKNNSFYRYSLKIKNKTNIHSLQIKEQNTKTQNYDFSFSIHLHRYKKTYKCA
jgi:hypothetical protein